MAKLSSNMEDYLEAILHLLTTHKIARTKDIADHLKVKMPSVNKALKKLADDGHVTYDPYTSTTLTKKGMRYAKNVIKKHRQIKNFIEHALGLPQEIAEKNACKLEHSLDQEIIDRLAELTIFLKNNHPKLFKK